MGHYAKVLDSVVVQVIVAEADFFESFVDSSPGAWVQTSYNTHGGVHYGEDGKPDGGVALRKNFAGVGFYYDAAEDAFYPPQPYPSWTLDKATFLWVPPVVMPTGAERYTWHEATQSWVEGD